MAWIKVEHELPDKPEVVAIAARLDLDQDAVATKCIRVWIWFERNTKDGNASGVTRSFLDRYVCAPGFAQAMVDVGWLVFENGLVTVPKFDKHNGEDAKQQALTAKRVRAHRSRVRNADGVTSVTPMCAGGGKGGVRNAPQKRAEGNAQKRHSGIELSDLTFPASLETTKAREAMEEWLQYKRARGESYKRASFAQKMLNEFGPLGSDAFVSAVNYSIGRNYAGLFYAKDQSSGNSGRGKPRDSAGSTFDPSATG